MASPTTYSKLGFPLKFLGLNMKNFVFFAPFIRSSFPSIAYPCWDHSGRTSIRNLMNVNIKIVAEVLPSSGADSTAKYSLATIQDLKLLKTRFQDQKSDMQISLHMLDKTVMQQFECFLVIP